VISLIIFCLVCLSITNLLVEEYIFLWLRNFINKIFPYSLLNKVIQCQTCLGFWVGFLLVLMIPNILPILGFGLIVNSLIGGLISSIINKIILITIYKI